MRIPLFPRLLLAFLALSLPPLLWLSLDAAHRIGEVGEEAVDRSTRALDAKARQALEVQAAGLGKQIARFLEERVQDVRILSELPRSPEALFQFCRTRTGEVWKRRRGSDGGIEEYRVRIPIYAEASWIDATGQEIFRVDGDWMAPSRSLRRVSDPRQTTYGVENYFEGALKMPPGGVYVGHLVGRHVSRNSQLAGAPTPEEAVGGMEYRGLIRFAIALREEGRLQGVVAVALDHAHLMEFTQHVLPLSRERVAFPSYLSGNYAFLFDDEGWIITHPKYWDIRGLDGGGRWVPAYSRESSPEDIEAGRIPFNLDQAGFVHPSYPQVSAAVRRGQSGVTRTFNVAGVDKVMAYAPIPFRHGVYASGGVFGGVTIGARTDAFHREVEVVGQAISKAAGGTLRTGLALGWGLVAVVLIAAFWASRAVARPVHNMAEMAGRIAAGDLTARVEIGRSDELGALGDALNRMGKLLEQKDVDLNESLQQLERSRDDARAYADRLEEQLRTLNHIQAISELLGTTFDREEVLRIILRTCVEGLGFDRVLLYLLDRGGNRLRCIAVHGFDVAEELRVRQRPFSLENDDCVPVRVVRTGHPVHVAEVAAAADLSELDRRLAQAGGTSSFVYVPMKIRDSVVGALGADNALSGGSIPDHRVNALQIVAGQAARAIERARLYKEAHRSRTFVETVIAALASGLVTLDPSGRVLTVNPYACDALGIDGGSARGRRLRECGIDSAVIEWVGSMDDGGELEASEFEVETPRGRRTFTWIPSRFGSDGEEGMILQFRDVTEERAMTRALERVNRLASLGRMAAGVAHEVRNPLTGVSLLLDDLHDRLPTEGDRTLAAGALREIERLERIVEELLEYARVRPVERRLCDMGEILEQSLFLVKKEAGNQGVAVSLTIEPGLPRVEADPEKLKQALLNLYVNALQAMGGGGSLDITVRQTAEGVAVSVADTGPGIPEGEIDRIFDPFYTLRAGGSGLGLSIAHSIVSDHDGRIEVTSSPGCGATFTLVFPSGEALRASG